MGQPCNRPPAGLLGAAATLEPTKRPPELSTGILGRRAGLSVQNYTDLPSTLKLAILESSAAIVVVHNHPSGHPEPSAEDQAITLRLKEAGELLGIKLLDHVVIGDGRYFSFTDQNLL
jgi:hypothetical protein